MGRYRTPTGRLIQSPFESEGLSTDFGPDATQEQDVIYDVRENADGIPDSVPYRTECGRTVFGGRGIFPAFAVQPDTASLAGFLRRRELDRFFALLANEWVAQRVQSFRSRRQHRPEAFLSSYRVPEEAVTLTGRTHRERGVYLSRRILRRWIGGSVSSQTQARAPRPKSFTCAARWRIHGLGRGPVRNCSTG